MRKKRYSITKNNIKSKKVMSFYALAIISLLCSCSRLDSTNMNNGQDEKGGVTDNSTQAESPKNSQTPIKQEELKEQEISNFKTPLKEKTKARMTNIRVSSEKINGKEIDVDEVFSFNETVGKRTMAKGYKKAIIFRNKEKVKEVGGGICQVSTTIYNSALIAGMGIVERHEHQLPVPYIEEGKDATVSYGILDLKFKNTTDKKIKIFVEITDDDVVCRIIKINY